MAEEESERGRRQRRSPLIDGEKRGLWREEREEEREEGRSARSEHVGVSVELAFPYLTPRHSAYQLLPQRGPDVVRPPD
ncbi:hypothetical protein EYF80_048998 [Liparis tanakae]|uniref:Uncharacterized protein n=1 Tax=Liparis tanakae TaxID=230148 RepID=A0A4Z2FIP1_9TELE|nr:hypothetical protein EYF80_048998 [Liparis tanakae]